MMGKGLVFFSIDKTMTSVTCDLQKKPVEWKLYLINYLIKKHFIVRTLDVSCRFHGNKYTVKYLMLLQFILHLFIREENQSTLNETNQKVW